MTSILYQTWVLCTRHEYSVPGPSILYQTRVFCTRHEYSVPDRTSILYQTWILCTRHEYSVQDTSIQYQTWRVLYIRHEYSVPDTCASAHFRLWHVQFNKYDVLQVYTTFHSLKCVHQTRTTHGTKHCTWTFQSLNYTTAYSTVRVYTMYTLYNDIWICRVTLLSRI